MKFIIKYFTLFIKRALIINTILLSGLFISNGQAAPDSTICPQQEVDVSSLYLNLEGRCASINVSKSGTGVVFETITLKSDGSPLNASPSATNIIRLASRYYATGTYTLTRSCTNDSNTNTWSLSKTVQVLDYTDIDPNSPNYKCVANSSNNISPKGGNYNNNYGNKLVIYPEDSTTPRCKNGANPSSPGNLNHSKGGIFYSNGSTTNNTPSCNIFIAKAKLEPSDGQIEMECTQSDRYKLWFAKDKRESDLSRITNSQWTLVKSSDIDTSYNDGTPDQNSGNNIFKWNGAYLTTSKGLFKLTCYTPSGAFIDTSATDYQEFGLEGATIIPSLSCSKTSLMLDISCGVGGNMYSLNGLGSTSILLPIQVGYSNNTSYKLSCWNSDNSGIVKQSNNIITIDFWGNCRNSDTQPDTCTGNSTDNPPVGLVGTSPDCVCPSNSTYRGLPTSANGGKCNDTSTCSTSSDNVQLIKYNSTCVCPATSREPIDNKCASTTECPQKTSLDSNPITIGKDDAGVCVCKGGILDGFYPVEGYCSKIDTCTMISKDGASLIGTPPTCYCPSGSERAGITPLGWDLTSSPANFGKCNPTPGEIPAPTASNPSGSCGPISSDFASINVNASGDCVCQAGELIGQVPYQVNDNKYCRTNWCTPGAICSTTSPIGCPLGTVAVDNTCKYKYIATAPAWNDDGCTNYASNYNYNFVSKLSGYSNYNSPADNYCSIELTTRTGATPGSESKTYTLLGGGVSFSTSSLYRYYDFRLYAGSSTAWCVFDKAYNPKYLNIENKCAAPAGIKLVANPSTLYLSGAQTKLSWNITDNKGKSCKLWGGQYGSYNNSNVKIGTSTLNLPYTYSTTTNKIINPTNYSITCVDAAGRSTTTQQVKVNIFSRGEV